MSRFLCIKFPDLQLLHFLGLNFQISKFMREIWKLRPKKSGNLENWARQNQKIGSADGQSGLPTLNWEMGAFNLGN